jgi:hypothetical protein
MPTTPPLPRPQPKLPAVSPYHLTPHSQRILACRGAELRRALAERRARAQALKAAWATAAGAQP